MQTQTIIVILNSGKTPDERIKLAEQIRAAFGEAGQKAHITVIQKDDDYEKISESCVKKAKESNGVVVAAGGDGTVNLVAGLCYRHGVTLGVIPLGTFNYFAREIPIPTEIAEAVEIIAGGHVKTVAIGSVNKHIFLNNASFGLYTKLIRQREQASSRFGRARIIAALAAAYSLFERQKLFTIKLNKDAEENWHKTSLVFVGNNTLQLENLGMDVANCTRQDNLAVVLMKETGKCEMANFLLRGMVKNLKDQSKLEEFCAERFEVTTERKMIELVIDGEIIRCATPLEFRIEKNALSVLAPLPESVP